jgi:RNA-binding protein 25
MKFEKLEESSSSSEEESESDTETYKTDRTLSSALMPSSASETKLENENNNKIIENMEIEEKIETSDKNNENGNGNENELDTESPKVEIPVPVPPPQLYSEESNTSQPQSIATNDENTKLEDNHYQSSSSLLEGLNSQVSTQLNELSCQLDKQSSNGDYSPGYSNSPIFSQSNSDIAHSFTGIKATSVTIKSMNTKSKFIAPKNQLFADEEEDQTVKKAKLSASALLESKSQAEEKRKAVKKLVESIPTDKDELFAYPIDWSQLDQSLMDKRIRPWINKKIIEYIGEEEQSLNDFICTKIEQHSKPDKLLEEVKVILDEEAELFVKKMWRLIVYETESKRCGLSK